MNHHLLFFFFIFTVTIFAAVPSSLAADRYYEFCGGPLRCGSTSLFPNITYPFWGVNKHKYCGQTGYELSCTDQQHLTLEIESVTLRVLSANLSTRIITVADERLFHEGCSEILNLSEYGRFSLASPYEKIDLFTCSPGHLSHSLPLPCTTSNGDSATYHYFRPGNSSGSSGCAKVGEVPVLRHVKEDLESTQSITSLKEALDRGFDLKYSIIDQSCERCTESGGICGSSLESETFQCLCQDKPHKSACDDQGYIYWKVKILIGAISSAVGIAILLAILAFFVRKRNTSTYRSHLKLKGLIPLKQYSYAEVKRITKSFTSIVGRGGFGTVYGGNLPDGRKVAVKILKDSKGNGEEFVNEVASMSKTSHVNIVSLLGFCYEGSKRAIIYEFLENGSLDKLISGMASSNTDWRTLYEITHGVARALEYLHYGCKTRIVHFDIKPQNVLLDQNLCPKVSDFGLAKLCEKKESIMSLLDTRGTIGYIAPEVFSRMYGDVSHKSDVYSYGMLVLEMVGARNREKVKHSASNTSSMYFPDWIYKDLEKGESTWLLGDEITAEEEEMAKKMIMVGLWCIQSRPSDRPPMNKVVEMMEGSLDALEVPPKPVLHVPAAPLSDSPWPSEDSLNSS